MNVFVTGGTGFVGRALISSLIKKRPFEITLAMRDPAHVPSLGSERVKVFYIDSLNDRTDWSEMVSGADVVIHCAARAHLLKDKALNPLQEYRRVNVEGTLNLARQAVAAGVNRFIFISSIKVNGESTARGQPFTADSSPNPIDPYGISKLEAEQRLIELAANSVMEIVIIRPVLVYGPGVKANFLNMMRWLYKGVPLPLGAIHNKRSLVALDNLVDLIVTCIDHPGAANQTFLVSDGEDLSTTELLRRMSQALCKRPHLLPVPAWMLETAAKVVGKQSIAQRLCGSLQVDISYTRERLGWMPPVSVDAALQKTAQYFLEQQKQ
ncbi:UDP-glucose 4-epimerase family protein [Thauera phenylacetica]|uniref:UDP-glucose 4-epimerase family protein n=1 Tax=Thauera phenylacetica TaxID=164400 RepID=UPI0039E2D71E